MDKSTKNTLIVIGSILSVGLITMYLYFKNKEEKGEGSVDAVSKENLKIKFTR